MSSVVWLPLACDPEMHAAKHDPARESTDICFIGNLIGRERLRLLQLIREKYSHTRIEQCYFEAMTQAYAESRVVFNRSVAQDINMRVFEALASGALLITDDLTVNGLAEFFQDGIHLATYGSDEELWDKLAYYLNNPDARRQVAQRGQQEALSHHTYDLRMRVILDMLGDQAKRTEKQGIFSAGRKGAGYYEHDRHDVLELIPQSARRVLDIGCGAGRLGSLVKERQQAEVHGVEMNLQAAEQARAVLDQVFAVDFEQEQGGLTSGQYDCVICADILEHLRRPDLGLQKIRHLLSDDGSLVISVPNVRHHTVIRSLLAGNWTYESAGLLDEDHVRFFTRREVEKLLFRAGFEVTQSHVVPGEGYSEWAAAGSPTALSIHGLQVTASSAADAAEFFAYQYLLTCRKTHQHQHGLTSIIMVTHNQLAYTQLCVDSLRLRTDEPYELIVVDNGSSDGTLDYLQSLPEATVLVNEGNRGFPAAVNQGLRVARGDNLLLLNNDVVVTTGWLRRMLDSLYRHEAVGMAGPVSNQVSGEQQVAAGYAQLGDLDGFAWDWAQQHAGQAIATDRLVGFCLLLKREVLQRLGELDERFGIGCFEDDDFCRRAIQAGYRLVIAEDAFVHHFGSVTFRGSGVDFGELMCINEQRFRKKWEQPQTAVPTAEGGQGYADPPSASGFEITAAPGGGLSLKPRRPRLSLCMIVRDNARTIRPCLESIRPWVDEMIVVDTGSLDETPDICQQLGARVYHWPWQDSFAAARNESLAHARGEWLFWMDSDDTIPAECGRQLSELAAGPHQRDVLGYVVQVQCPGRDDDVTVVDHVKLFRNRPDLRFEFRIHEQILPAIRRAGGEVEWTDLYVVHSGSDNSPEARRRKRERDLRLLRRELVERPEHPFVLFNLGMTYCDGDEYQQAIHYLTRCIAVSGSEESHLRKAYSLLAGALKETGRRPELEQICRAGLQLFPSDKELLFRQAMVRQDEGQLGEARDLYLRVLYEETERTFGSVDAHLANVKARYNLALVYEQLGDAAAAEEQWRTVTRQQPGFRLAWQALAELLARQRRSEDIAGLAKELSAGANGRSLAGVLAARATEVRGDCHLSRQQLEQVLIHKPDDVELHQAYCRLLFEQFDPHSAAAALERLIELEPDDPAAHHNLGTAQMRIGNYAAAVTALETSLRLRADSRETNEHLEAARAALHEELEKTAIG